MPSLHLQKRVWGRRGITTLMDVYLQKRGFSVTPDDPYAFDYERWMEHCTENLGASAADYACGNGSCGVFFDDDPRTDEALVAMLKEELAIAEKWA